MSNTARSPRNRVLVSVCEVALQQAVSVEVQKVEKTFQI